MHALAALVWDPQIRGVVIVLTAFVILVGSAYMLLATNLGGRLGFLVTLACLTGWMTTLGAIWAVYGIGDKGPAPAWKPKVVTSSASNTVANPVLQGFPNGWRELPEGNPKRAEEQTTVDETLINADKATKFGFTKFLKATDYLPLKAYEKGGQKHNLLGISIFGKGLTISHSPHYAVIQVQGAVAQTAQPGQAPPKPKIDPSAPVFTVLMERDLGALRLPSLVITWASGLLFAVTLSVLHRRDKAAMAARGLLPAPTGAGAG